MILQLRVLGLNNVHMRPMEMEMSFKNFPYCGNSKTFTLKIRSFIILNLLYNFISSGNRGSYCLIVIFYETLYLVS